jgi:hypothetical protein
LNIKYVEFLRLAIYFRKSSLSDSSVFFSIDSFDNIYAADTLNHTIRKVTPEGLVTTLAGSAGWNGTADGIGLSSRFFEPSKRGQMELIIDI